MPSFLYKNLNVHYSDQGTGNCIVLLHGFLEDLSMWDKVVEALKKTHRVICIDLLGHGKTESLGYIHTMEAQGIIIKHLLDSLSLTHYAGWPQYGRLYSTGLRRNVSRSYFRSLPDEFYCLGR